MLYNVRNDVLLQVNEKLRSFILTKTLLRTAFERITGAVLAFERTAATGRSHCVC